MYILCVDDYELSSNIIHVIYFIEKYDEICIRPRRVFRALHCFAIALSHLDEVIGVTTN